MREDAALQLLTDVRRAGRKVRRAQAKVRAAQAELDDAATARDELIEQMLTGLVPARAADRVAAVRPQTPDGSKLITSSDLARLAGVSRAAVSNWKIRHPDFPAPTDDSEPPRYLRQDAEAFLINHGYLSEEEAMVR